MPDRNSALSNTALSPEDNTEECTTSDRMVSAFRHDLRTAIGQVTGYSELLMEEATDSGYNELLPDLERVWKAGRKALDLIDVHLSRTSPILSLSDLIPAPTPVTSPIMAPVSTVATAKPTQIPGRILVVDDNAENRDLLTRQLTTQGHETVATIDGESALQTLQEQPFDLVLLDVMMPGIGGFETLRRLKAEPALQHLPVLMVSAREDTETVVSCIEAGAIDYLTKPFNPVLLKARVEACLRAKRLRDREEQLLQEVQASLERERRIADALQRSLVREVPPNIFPTMTVATLYEAAWTEAQVGGDLFDAFRLPQGDIALAVADASGKGLDAAARVAQVKYALRAYAREADGDVVQIATRLNDFLCDSGVNADASLDGSFVTLALAVIDTATGDTRLVSAGCESPLILRAASGIVEPVLISGPPLGILSDVPYERVSCRLETGDILLLYTDGITESRSGGDLFGEERLTEAILAGWDRSGKTDLHLLATAVLESARTFGKGTLRDDACLLLVRREPLPASN